MLKKRSLYQCLNAKVLIDTIYCAKAHSLSGKGWNLSLGDKRGISIRRLSRGTPLELTVCQYCLDYSEMGPPVAKEDRGWE